MMMAPTSVMRKSGRSNNKNSNESSSSWWGYSSSTAAIVTLIINVAIFMLEFASCSSSFSEITSLVSLKDNSTIVAPIKTKELIRGGPAEQSGTYSLSGFNYDASLAIDGVIDTNFQNEHCSSILGSGTIWWRAKLHEPSVVMYVNLFGRSDCCANRFADLSIYVTDVVTDPALIPESNLCGKVDAPTFGVTVGSVRCKHQTGQWITIKKANPTSDTLELCSVMAFGTSPCDETKCQMDISTCKALSDGVNFQCDCRSGYKHPSASDAKTCVDIDECADKLHNCTSAQRCLNYPGSFLCIN